MTGTIFTLAGTETTTGDSEWVTPGEPGWPSLAQWDELNREVDGRLSRVRVPNVADAETQKLLRNPFYIGEQAGLTQISGWAGAWRSAPSAYVVAAKTATDIAAAIRFARVHNVRLIVKGGGHSYFGASTSPDSLLIWTRRMQTVTVHDAFIPQGCLAAPVPAVSAGAGCIWLQLYQAVTGRFGRYVQGGGCTTVGVPGLVLGGGFGSFSKRYGLAAASLLEAEIVTADGKLRVVNAAQDSDLFWALKGGGGGTFGVVTRVTLRTHELPATFGSVRLDVQAHSDQAYRQLLARFVALYATRMFNAHWGENVVARPDNLLQVRMVFQDLTRDAALAVWQPLIDYLHARPGDYAGIESLQVNSDPARSFWDADYNRRYAGDSVVFDDRTGASPEDFWWSSDSREAGGCLHAYMSAWLPASLLDEEGQVRLVDAWFAASRQWALGLVFSKGLAGASPAVTEAARNTAMNPEVVDAFAWAVTHWYGPPIFAGMPPPQGASAAAVIRVRAANAMAVLRTLVPNAGTYLSECDYFQPDWQRAFWGANYAGLLKIKERYDPDGLFTVHHGVGSEN